MTATDAAPVIGSPDPAGAVDAYRRHAVAGSSAPPPPPPVAMPVRERVGALATGELDTSDWLATANAWQGFADARYRACVDLRPTTASIRVGVKDTVDVAGYATRLGLRRHRHYPRRGAVALGALGADMTPASGSRQPITVAVNAKVVATELNIGIGTGCVNPYFPHIDPAGSSTGSGVAVAAGICDLSLATDVLGSARWPAGRCGVVGLRVTHDVRILDGIFPLAPSMDAPGWLARTVDDLVFLWPLTGLTPAPTGAGRLRVGVVQEVLDEDVEPEIRAALWAAADGLASAGHTVTRVRTGGAWQRRGWAWELCARQAWDGFRRWRDWIDDDLSAATRLALEAGSAVSDDRYGEILAAQAADRAGVTAWFAERQVDVWMLPLDPDLPRERHASPPATTIPTAQRADYDRSIGYTPLASFLGLPAITLPVGRTASDAPLAVQLVGPPHSESVLTSLASDLARAVGDLGFALR